MIQGRCCIQIPACNVALVVNKLSIALVGFGMLHTMIPADSVGMDVQVFPNRDSDWVGTVIRPESAG